MYLIDFDILNRQLMPPHWRDTYKETILNVLLSQFKNVLNNALFFKNEALNQQNINAQTGVIEYVLNKKYAIEGYRYIEIVDGASCEVVAYVSTNYAKQKENIKNEIKKYLPLGFIITIKDK